MTTFAFVQPPSGPFSFSPTLDGQVYNVTVPWILFGARYYVQIQDQGGNLILYVPQISSTDPSPTVPDGFDVNLIQGYFTLSTMTWSDSDQQFTVLP